MPAVPLSPVTTLAPAPPRPRLVVSIGAAPTTSTTTRSPVITLQPTPADGKIPGDANDGSDFYGLGAALIAIVLILVVANRAFRNRRPERRERED